MNSGILTQNNEEFYPVTQANLVKTSDGQNIEEKFGWNKIGSKVGYDSISLPSDFNEIKIVAKSSWKFEISIPKGDLQTSQADYVNGAYYDSATHPIVIFSCSTSNVVLNTATTNYASCEWSVYYR